LETLELYKTITFEEHSNYINSQLWNHKFSNDSKYIIFSYWDNEDYNPQKVIVWDIEKDSVAYEYLYAADKFIDVSKDDYIAAVGIQVPTIGWSVNLLRPKWNGTDVKETKENELNYSYYGRKIKIYFNENLKNEPKIEIYNILGVGIRHAEPVQQENEIEIDLNDLSSGIYFVEVLVNFKTYIIKINNY